MSATGSRSPLGGSGTGSPPPEHDLDARQPRRSPLAEHRLDSCGIRGRRHARRDLAAADNRLTWANHTLEQTQASISPDVDRYHHAGQQVRDLRDALRSHDTAELFDRYTTTDRIPHLQERLDALDTWWRFAKGDKIDVPRLAEVVDILDRRRRRPRAVPVARRRRRAVLPRRRHPPPNPRTRDPRHRTARPRHRAVTTTAAPRVVVERGARPDTQQ